MNRRKLILGVGSWVVGGAAGNLAARGEYALKDRWRQNSGLGPEDEDVKSRGILRATALGAFCGGVALYYSRKKLDLN